MELQWSSPNEVKVVSEGSAILNEENILSEVKNGPRELLAYMFD